MGKHWKVVLEVEQHIEADKLGDAVDTAVDRVSSNSIKMDDLLDIRVLAVKRMRREAEG